MGERAAGEVHNVLAQKLLIEAAEEQFLAMANVS